ncbi:adenylosuccinate lyase [Fulvivirga sp. RKSG066]|uniref:adenylosuccinate lyase n=1 Tax=Fulvivirga aurantia TaxID=2529383 RepID=UPI0012BD475C|nr:adenylosuccinate lyase [Fulvivirga aurantia]MTI20699.1 adenylosuccinate lyase [Fulvivirga aurantia]
MQLNELTAISPVDGRYRRHTSALSTYLSEYGLIRYRVLVEIEYFIALCELPISQLAEVKSEQYDALRSIYKDFSEEDAQSIKDIEKTTNHDVKAVEYFIKSKMEDMGFEDVKEFVHFGLTSQDINNTAIPLSLKEAVENIVLPLVENVSNTIASYANKWADIPMLAKTHGQPASPTRLGKEFMVFKARIDKQLFLLKEVPHSAKFGGATGNFNAHHVAYPDTDWVQFGNDFVRNHLGLERSHPTTQIEHYDNMAALFDGIKRINTILIDFSRDIWQYISMGYFKQKIKEGEVGSSAMPHKVNPIDFENAEGNLGMANAIFEHLSAKLPISRLQRDLTDSTVLRNIGIPLSHTVIAFNSLAKGLGKIELNETAINNDLEDNWAVVAEAIQTILRRENYPKPYEALKGLTRTNSKITKETIHEFIDTLEVDGELKSSLKEISPMNYTGV